MHALLGENGAGKSTLMRIAFGMLRPDSGKVILNGVNRSFSSPHDAIDAGIGMVHQHFTLVPAMTVTENIALGGCGIFHPRRTREAVLALSDRTGLALDPNARVEDLPTGAQQRAEILKALSRDARILILDEPTAVLTPVEARELLRNVRDLVSKGVTAILITHKIRDALEFADEITVLRHGSTIWSGSASSTTEDGLVATMLGAKLTPKDVETPAGTTVTGNAAMISLRNVSVRDKAGVQRLSSVTLSIRAGEIVGIAAVEGNGQRELLRLLSGRIAATTGDVTIPSVVGFIPEDRQRDAMIEEFSLRDNVALLGAGNRKGMTQWQAVSQHARDLIDAYDVRVRDEDVRAGALSGGNQQKLVVGREIDGSHAALVAENPTRGLDVQAAASVHARIRGARDAGMAVVIYSSDLDEVLDLADRVLVVCAGQIHDAPRDYESVGRAMLGLSPS